MRATYNLWQSKHYLQMKSPMTCMPRQFLHNVHCFCFGLLLRVLSFSTISHCLLVDAVVLCCWLHARWWPQLPREYKKTSRDIYLFRASSERSKFFHDEQPSYAWGWSCTKRFMSGLEFSWVAADLSGFVCGDTFRRNTSLDLIHPSLIHQENRTTWLLSQIVRFANEGRGHKVLVFLILPI